jgi:hypothetical protein
MRGTKQFDLRNNCSLRHCAAHITTDTWMIQITNWGARYHSKPACYIQVHVVPRSVTCRNTHAFPNHMAFMPMLQKLDRFGQVQAKKTPEFGFGSLKLKLLSLD